jgi:hypothetical protein
MAAVGQESVGLSEIMPSQQEDGGQHEGTGYRLMTNPNEADDIVDDHQTRKDTQEANRVAAEMGVSAKELSQPSNFQTAAEVRAEEIAQANREAHAAKERERTDVPVTDIDQVEMRQLRWFDHRGMPIKEEGIEEAAMEYDGVVNRLGGNEQFYDMPEAEQLRVVKNYIGYMDDAINAKQFKDFLKGIFNEREKQLEAEAARQREAEEKADVQRLPGRDGEGTNVEQTAEAADQAEDAGTEEGLTPQDISAAWNALAEENNLPKFAELLDDQRQALLEAYDEESLQSAANVVAQEVQDEAAGEVLDEINDDQGAAKFSEADKQPTNEQIDAWENGMLTLDEFMPTRFPAVDSAEISYPGPGGRFTPKAIRGAAFYRETNGEGLFDLLAYDKQYNFNRTYVATKPEIALGQGGNTGINVVFRSKSLSGTENVKPGTGKIAGREYVTEVIAPRAVVEVKMSPVAEKGLRPLVRRVLASEFNRTVEDGQLLIQWTSECSS